MLYGVVVVVDAGMVERCMMQAALRSLSITLARSTYGPEEEGERSRYCSHSRNTSHSSPEMETVSTTSSTGLPFEAAADLQSTRIKR